MDKIMIGVQSIFALFLICVSGTQVRLTGDTSNATGLVEIFYKGEWYNVDQSHMTDTTANVICKMLGYGNSGIAEQLRSTSSYPLYGAGSPRIINEDFQCAGNESDISQCAGGSSWRTTSSASVLSAITCEASTLRLVDSATPRSGRVEIFIKGAWHTICDSSFDNDDARVICSMLGYNDTGIAFAFTGSTFGQGYGDSAVQSLQCKGNERDIKSCTASWGDSCDHRSDAGVRCSGTVVRLVNGVDSASGRVEIEHAGEWGTVCGNSNFDNLDAHVICRMLGYNNTGAFGHGSAFYGIGHSPVVATLTHCDGSESDIAQCASFKWLQPSTYTSCNHGNDIGVNCNGRSTIRLVDGRSEQSGRLEIFHNGHWGSVSATSGFDRQALLVVCKMLGYEYSEHSFYKPLLYGRGTGEVSMSSVRCHGDEQDIGQCAGTWWPNTRSTTHDSDVGISCDGKLPIRLVGGHNNATGRVEVYHNGKYGTICDRGFDRMDLQVVCRMLGYDTIPQSAYWHAGAYFGQGLGEIIAEDLNCVGYEHSIGACPGTWPASTYYCHHDNDVSVSCDASEQIRLIGAQGYSGRVAILHNGQLGRVCGQNFDRMDAVVLCRMIGHAKPEEAVVLDSTKFGNGNGTVILNDLKCNGLETSIEQCNPTWLPNSCSNSYGDAAIDCCPSCTQAQIIG